MKYYYCVEGDKAMDCTKSTEKMFTIQVPDSIPDMFDPIYISWKLKKPIFTHKGRNSSNGEGTVRNSR